MSRRNYAKSQLFLMEFIVVVLFFALCASICIHAFVKADQKSKESKELNHALILAQSAAESIKAVNDEDLDRLGKLIGLYEVKGNEYQGFYAEDFKRIDGKIDHKSIFNNPKAVYVMEVTSTVENQMMTAKITVRHKEAKEIICKLEVKKYLPEEV